MIGLEREKEIKIQATGRETWLGKFYGTEFHSLSPDTSCETKKPIRVLGKGQRSVPPETSHPFPTEHPIMQFK